MNYITTIQTIIDTLPFFVMVIDEDHNILCVNDKVLTTLGKNQKDIIGGYCPKTFHGIDEPYPGCPLEEALKTGKPVIKSLFDSFYEKWVSSAIYPMSLKTQDGKGIFLHIVYDISDLKQAEETIRQQNEYLENILESLTQPFYIIDANDYTIVKANSAANFGKITKNSKCYKLTHKHNEPCNSAEHPCPIREIKKTKEPIKVEHIHYTRDGKPIDVEVHGYPIFNSDEKITHIIEYTLNITERKRTEKELKKTQNELEIKTKNLEENYSALKVLLKHLDEEKRSIKRNILANIKILVFPYLEKLENSLIYENNRTLLNIIKTNLSEVIKPIATKLTSKIINLSPNEVRVANMVKDGKTSKEIADIIHISENTVKEHKSYIRSKLGIKKKKVNLRSYLQSILDE